MKPDPTFYASAKLAMQAPPENFAFTVMLGKDADQHDGLAVIDLRKGSKTYGEIVHKVMTETTGDEFHHFGWNACSSSLSPLSGHAFLERRYLIVPGIRSSRIFIFDVKDPLKAHIHKIIDIELTKLYNRIDGLGYALKLSETAKDYIADKGFDKKYGARPLKRAIQKYIEDSLAEEIINSKLKEGDSISIDLNKKTNELIIKITKKKQKAGE